MDEQTQEQAIASTITQALSTTIQPVDRASFLRYPYAAPMWVAYTPGTRSGLFLTYIERRSRSPIVALVRSYERPLTPNFDRPIPPAQAVKRAEPLLLCARTCFVNDELHERFVEAVDNLRTLNESR